MGLVCGRDRLMSHLVRSLTVVLRQYDSQNALIYRFMLADRVDDTIISCCENVGTPY